MGQGSHARGGMGNIRVGYPAHSPALEIITKPHKTTVKTTRVLRSDLLQPPGVTYKGQVHRGEVDCPGSPREQVDSRDRAQFPAIR